ncbi:response regulator transcription factor [Dehalobacterium formicoaceticum]|uniref:Stage 0 sporulation protein A homolog n=1 Tax=Dehalobacterium formicoaceticum TaxID=51515 RepID=A0ABT1Y8D2_9FIRM|nr:response regulator transcription factor [Dehalobacterium formicoaceticum]MCR6547146.1 response regulator transcription factor [Dehalobacterium formicoaceticum]
MNTKPLVLIVEDEESISNFVSFVLTNNSFQVINAKTGNEGILMAATCTPDIILLDLGLPDIDELEVLKNIRERSNSPIIIDTAHGNEREEVAALNMGANDYLAKPFTTDELLTRIRMVIKGDTKFIDGNGKVVIGELVIDYDKRAVFLSNKKIRLPPIEYELLSLLSKNTGKILTHDSIIKQIWGENSDGRKLLRSNMAALRRKIEANPATPKYILAELGVGYRMNNNLP